MLTGAEGGGRAVADPGKRAGRDAAMRRRGGQRETRKRLSRERRGWGWTEAVECWHCALIPARRAGESTNGLFADRCGEVSGGLMRMNRGRHHGR